MPLWTGTYANIRARELSLRDLGYFSIYDLKNCGSKSILCVTYSLEYTSLSKEKGGKWTLLDLEKLTKDLSEGQILELPEIYIGLHQKHKTRLVIYRLTQTEWTKRLEHHKKAKRRCRNMQAVSTFLLRTYLVNTFCTMKYMNCILYGGKLKLYLKHGSLF